jgi:hypothetical protein
MGDKYRPLGVGDTVKVLRASRLPVEEVLGVGPIERTSRSNFGEMLYWIRGFDCARTERVLRRWTSLSEALAEQDEAEHEG